MERKYFGTDGIRGKVGEEPVTPAFIMKLGWAVGRVLAGKNGGKVLIGKDTRISGYMFESALEAGLSAAGMNVRLLGPMPTPAIAYLTRTLHAQAGIVISASHNPYYDNGIKFFSSDGYKLNDGIESAIEAELEKDMVCVASEKLGKAERVVDVEGRYIEFCKSTVPFSMSLSGMTIVIDCAHGACYKVAPAVLDELGAKVISIGNHPNGININDGVGSTQPSALQQAVLQHKADLGIALDGDGDRVLMVDHKGELIDGDELLYIIARYMQTDRRLRGPVVGTLMSNLGLEIALQQQGLAFIRSKVGDRYVMEQLQQSGGVLGGETSGHLICLDRSTTGDGMIAALQVLHAMVQSGKTLHELKAGMAKYPQLLENVVIKGKVDLNHARIQSAVQMVEQRLGRRGRVLLRPSGTEPLIRVMVEGEDADEVKELTDHIADAVRTAIM